MGQLADWNEREGMGEGDYFWRKRTATMTGAVNDLGNGTHMALDHKYMYKTQHWYVDIDLR